MKYFKNRFLVLGRVIIVVLLFWVFIRLKAERSMLAVGELFVWARSARSQARSACVIARRRLALPPRGTKTSTPTAEGRWGAANLSAKPKVRRPPQARRGEAASY